jgi:uncharacterized protein YabE (DUF348 family)
MMKLLHKSSTPYGLILVISLVIFLIFSIISSARVQAKTDSPTSGQRLITIHDNGQEKAILTEAETLRQAFDESGVRIDASDMVEPGLDDMLVASNYEVNIYRARPVTIIDGAIRQKVMSPYRTAAQIITNAGMKIQNEDLTTMSVTSDMVSDGAGMQLVIDRATPFTLVLYGKKTKAYTQATTIAEMLEEKGITIGAADELSVAQTTSIKAGMTVELWRNGKQTVTRDEKIAFDVEQIQDMDREIGYKDIKTPGVKGERTVTYEIDIKNGREVSRKEIQSVVTKEPKNQIEVVGGRLNLPPGSHEDWMRAAGMSSNNFGYINAIFAQESGWNPAAANPNGLYVGLGQTNPSNLSSACPQWQSDPICQIKYFNGYAQSRYGTWENAYYFKFGEPGGGGGNGWW